MVSLSLLIDFHLHICCSPGFARVRLALFSASFTFVWRAQALWLSLLNAWFDTLSLQEFSNFVKFIKNS